MKATMNTPKGSVEKLSPKETVLSGAALKDSVTSKETPEGTVFLTALRICHSCSASKSQGLAHPDLDNCRHHTARYHSVSAHTAP